MSSHRPRLVAGIALAAMAAWGSYETRGILVLSALLALLALGLLGYCWKQAGRRRADVFSDPAVSTLVFPPESKFQQSVFPRR